MMGINLRILLTDIVDQQRLDEAIDKALRKEGIDPAEDVNWDGSDTLAGRTITIAMELRKSKEVR